MDSSDDDNSSTASLSDDPMLSAAAASAASAPAAAPAPAASAPAPAADDPRQHTPPPLSHATGDHMDLDAYAALYSGRTKIFRLIFIADRSLPSSPLHLDALRMAYDEIKTSTIDTHLHRHVSAKIASRLGPLYLLDTSWADAVDSRANLRHDKIQSELNNNRANSIKEGTRMCYNDLGDLYYARGQLADALNSFVMSRDYCTTSKHMMQMRLKAILISIECGHYANVNILAMKADHGPDKLDPVTVSKLRCAVGLAYLHKKSYKLAAREFLETEPELGNKYSEVIAPQDVAIYGGICALASYDRAELKKKVLHDINFGKFLELVPEVRELINDFYASRYASCLEHLEKLKPNLLLDIHLHDHVERLYTKIRHKAITQYTFPFISVDLHQMAAAFKSSVAGLEKELEALITENQIQARIDSQNKVLYARHADQRNTTFQRVLQTGEEFDKDVKAMLLRANLMKHNSSRGSRKL